MPFGKYITVVTASMLKFIGGPLAGLALQLSMIETAICTIIGMMLTVNVVLFLWQTVQLLLNKKGNSKKSKVFNKRTRLAVSVKRKLGLWGIAFLTPLLFTPIGGTLISVSFRYPKLEILSKMLVSAIIWGILQTIFFFYVKNLVIA